MYTFKAYYEDREIFDSYGKYDTLAEVRHVAELHIKVHNATKVEISLDGLVYETLPQAKLEEEEGANMAYQTYYRIRITREDDFVYYENCYYKSSLRAIQDAKELSENDEYKEVEVIQYVPELLKKVKEKPQYHVLWGLVNKKYYVWSNKLIPFHANVFIKTYDSKEEAERHADELNKFVEGK